MPEQRHVYRAGHSVVVPLPRSVREHLHADAGDALYFHTARSGEAVLSKRPRRVGGGPEGLGLARQLDAARAEVERLKRRLAARPSRLLNEGRATGWHDALRADYGIGAQLAQIQGALVELIEHVANLPGGRRRRARRPAPQESATEVVTAPLLSSPPPSEVEVERGDDRSGQPAPAVPLEAEACSERDGAV